MDKNAKTTLLSLLAVIATTLLFLTACETSSNGDNGDDDADDDSDESADELVQEGKEWLSKGVPLVAREKFLQALEIEPDHPLALYGVTIADSMHTLEVLNIIIMYINMALDPGFEGSKPVGSLDDLVDAALQGLATEIADEAVEYVNTCLEKGATEFVMDLPIPIIIDFKHECDVMGRFSQAELYAIWAFNLTLAGIMRHALALELDLDIGLAQGIADIDFSNLPAAICEIVDILSQIMNDAGHPNFLGIEDGEIPTYKEAGRDTGLGLLKFGETIYAITQKPADNRDDIFGYMDLNGNGYWDSTEPLRIPCLGILDKEQTDWLHAILNVATDLGNSFIDYSEYDPDPYNPDPFDLATLNQILVLLGFPAIIPSGLIKIDFGAMYVNPDTNVVRSKVLDLINLVNQLFCANEKI